MATRPDLLSRFAPRLLYDSRERSYATSIEGVIDVVYGRVVGDWLQWWCFYERDWPPVPWRKGHEADWEGLQVRLGDDGFPNIVALAQHAGGEVCRWEDMATTGEHPHVYVGLGRHASYPSPSSRFGRANGRGRAVVPRVELASVDGWADHPRWGSDAHSPRSPGKQWRWNSPDSWAASL